MSDGSEIGCAFAGLISGAVIMAFVMGCLGTPDRAWHAEAVKHGAAHYVTDELGETTFVWNGDTEKRP